MRGRPRNPSDMQEMSGAWDRNPNRRRVDAATEAPIDIHNPPSGLTEHELELWREIVMNAPIRVLRNSDKFLVEMTAKALAEIRYPPAGMTYTQKNASRANARSMLSLMGMTPADRTRVVSEPEIMRTDEDDALDEFIIY